MCLDGAFTEFFYVSSVDVRSTTRVCLLALVFVEMLVQFSRWVDHSSKSFTPDVDRVVSQNNAMIKDDFVFLV